MNLCELHINFHFYSQKSSPCDHRLNKPTGRHTAWMYLSQRWNPALYQKGIFNRTDYGIALCLIESSHTFISCRRASIVDSRALVPRAASSSTVFTVFSNEVTLVTMTFADSFRAAIAGSAAGLPAAFFVQPMSSDRADATSLTAFISSTCGP